MDRIPRLLCAVAALLAVPACTGSGAADEESSKRVVIANFGGAVKDAAESSFWKPFTADSGIGVQSDPAGGGFTAKLQAQAQSGRVSWDVIEALEGSDAVLLSRLGLLEQLPADLTAQLTKSSVPDSVQPFGVSMGDTGVIIACNMQVVKKCPKNPTEFWDVNNFPGRRAMIDNPYESMASALVADGVPTDKVFPIDVDRALRKLDQLKPAVNVWTRSGDQQMQVLRSGEVGMSFMWSGRAKSLAAQGVKLKTSWDGSLVNPSYTVVVKKGPNTAGALNYLKWYATHPDAQAKLIDTLGYGTSHAEAGDKVKPETRAWMPSDPANSKNQVRIDSTWWADNRSKIEPRWRDFIAR
ncbi:extracellular solute-binding protein [Actinomadura madurae]|uniref:extracellular solute-binding protein n=1 Tax=Actinomadura madurae TaxID=1993 RepID=UPI0020D2136C|nr:extracellular solute-binding protein [Actinomadura madurae]MCP9950884.1 extracellular solute-binding protein [Actinomadura madurae]MCP9967671.1 extracellular solute-binding protein [Actinomadura madurae]MCP9980119.1 extracellular solute-binding protein [Actinomadura madurae]MCQ0008352.1 extracellular solute-binding protein [Actinomadura madurae]MCQ0016331.1 extracellular solute-binding protein [Actinomadura madurae]